MVTLITVGTATAQETAAANYIANVIAPQKFSGAQVAVLQGANVRTSSDNYVVAVYARAMTAPTTNREKWWAEQLKDSDGLRATFNTCVAPNTNKQAVVAMITEKLKGGRHVCVDTGGIQQAQWKASLEKEYAGNPKVHFM